MIELFFVTPIAAAARRSGVRMVVGGNGSVRAFFGPFLKGEVVPSILLTMFPTGALPVVADGFSIQVAVFAERPADSTTGFALGRGFFDPNSLPRIPSTQFPIYLPVNFVATEKERFLGIQLTELANNASDGGCFLDLGDPIGLSSGV